MSNLAAWKLSKWMEMQNSLIKRQLSCSKPVIPWIIVWNRTAPQASQFSGFKQPTSICYSRRPKQAPFSAPARKGSNRNPKIWLFMQCFERHVQIDWNLTDDEAKTKKEKIKCKSLFHRSHKQTKQSAIKWNHFKSNFKKPLQTHLLFCD